MIELKNRRVKRDGTGYFNNFPFSSFSSICTMACLQLFKIDDILLDLRHDVSKACERNFCMKTYVWAIHPKIARSFCSIVLRLSTCHIRNQIAFFDLNRLNLTISKSGCSSAIIYHIMSKGNSCTYYFQSEQFHIVLCSSTILKEIVILS